MTFSRRTFLAGAATLAAAPAVSHGALYAASSTPFTLGVASGDPATDGFVLWTRLALSPVGPAGEGLADRVPVRWTVAFDPGFDRIAARGWTSADRRLGHSVHVEVGGLPANRPYWYRFEALGYQSETGRSRSTPRPGDDLSRLRFGVASCANWERGYFSAYRHMAEEDFDVIFFLGDYIYEYSLGPERAAEVVRPYGLPEARSLDDYRARYALHRSDPDLRAAHASAPFVVTWDDHEVQDDYSALWSSRPGVSTEVFARRRAAAYQAYYENMPLRRSALPRGPNARLYRRLRYGQLADFFVLDGRQHRSRQPCLDTPAYGKGHIAPDSCADLQDPTRSLLGAAQERWLYDGFRRADATWNVLAQNLLMAPLRATPKSREAAWWTDTWDGYAAGRMRLLDAIDGSGLSNPLVLTGDYHSFFSSQLHLDPTNPASKPIAVEVAGTSITSTGPSHAGITGILPDNPHVKFFDSRHRGYVSIDLTPSEATVKLQKISDRTDPRASLETLYKHGVSAGLHGVIG